MTKATFQGPVSSNWEKFSIQRLALSKAVKRSWTETRDPLNRCRNISGHCCTATCPTLVRNGFGVLHMKSQCIFVFVKEMLVILFVNTGI